MARPHKTVAGAYGMAVLGLLLGIIGMHRFYVRRYVSATLMTGLFLVGLYFLVSDLLLQYYGLLDSLTGALSGLSSDGNFASIPDLTFTPPEKSNKVQYGIILCGAGVVWWLLDLLFIPRMVDRFQRASFSD